MSEMFCTDNVEVYIKKLASIISYSLDFRVAIHRWIRWSCTFGSGNSLISETEFEVVLNGMLVKLVI